MKISCASASIRGMNSYVFNAELGRYERFPGFLTGKSPPQIADEYGITEVRARQYAHENRLPYLGEENSVFVYVYTADAEQAFINRKTKPGPKAVPKPPKVPGKPGRPRKEKPAVMPVKKPKKKAAVEAGIPKRGRGRPRKN